MEREQLRQLLQVTARNEIERATLRIRNRRAVVDADHGRRNTLRSGMYFLARLNLIEKELRSAIEAMAIDLGRLIQNAANPAEFLELTDQVVHGEVTQTLRGFGGALEQEAMQQGLGAIFLASPISQTGLNLFAIVESRLAQLKGTEELRRSAIPAPAGSLGPTPSPTPDLPGERRLTIKSSNLDLGFERPLVPNLPAREKVKLTVYGPAQVYQAVPVERASERKDLDGIAAKLGEVHSDVKRSIALGETSRALGEKNLAVAQTLEEATDATRKDVDYLAGAKNEEQIAGWRKWPIVGALAGDARTSIIGFFFVLGLLLLLARVVGCQMPKP